MKLTGRVIGLRASKSYATETTVIDLKARWAKAGRHTEMHECSITVDQHLASHLKLNDIVQITVK